MPKCKVLVKINGAEYTLVGDESEEYLLSVAHYVDKKVKEILKFNIKHSNTSAAILTSVTMADELFKGKREIEHLKKALIEPEQKLKDLQVEYENLKKDKTVSQAENDTLKLKAAETANDLSMLKENYDKLYESYNKVNADFEKLLNEFSAVKELENELKQENTTLKESVSKLKDELLDKEIEYTKVSKDLKEFRNMKKSRL